MQTKNKNKVKIILDILMALVFAVLFNKTVLGGMAFHEIAGLAVGAAIIFHSVLNRAWIKGVTKKIFSPKLPARTRAAYIVDILLLVSLAVIIITGVLISKVLFPNILNVHGNVSALHKSVSYIALLLIGVHVGLSWDRVVSIMKKLLKLPNKKALGVLSTTAAIIIFSVGSYNIVSTGYFSKVASITSAYSEKGYGGHVFSEGDESYAKDSETALSLTVSSYGQGSITADAISSASINNNSQSATSDNSSLSSTNNSQSQTSDSSALANSGNGKSGGHGQGTGNGAMDGNGQEDSSGMFSTIYENLSILAAFAIFTFYIDKFLKRSKKQKIVKA